MKTTAHIPDTGTAKQTSFTNKLKSFVLTNLWLPGRQEKSCFSSPNAANSDFPQAKATTGHKGCLPKTHTSKRSLCLSPDPMSNNWCKQTDQKP